MPRKMTDTKPTTRIIPIQRVRTSSLTLPQQQQPKVMPVPERDDRSSSFNRSYRKSSTLDRGRPSNTFPRPIHRPAATSTTSVPIQIPVNYQKVQAQRLVCRAIVVTMELPSILGSLFQSLPQSMC